MHTHIQKSLPHWVVGLQDKTPTCYSVKPLFMVLFLQVYKILVWTTRLLYVLRSHIWGLLVCLEWLWGIRADAVAWDPSYNNTDSYRVPSWQPRPLLGPACSIYVKHQTRYRGPLPCLLTNLSGHLPRAALRLKSLIWHHHTSLSVCLWVDLCGAVRNP